MFMPIQWVGAIKKRGGEMTVIVDYRTGGKEENKDVECFWEDSHYLYLKFKESCKVKQKKYIRRNVKLNCIMDSEVEK